MSVREVSHASIQWRMVPLEGCIFEGNTCDVAWPHSGEPEHMAPMLLCASAEEGQQGRP